MHYSYNHIHQQMQMIELKLHMRFKTSSAPNHVGVFKTYVQFVILLCAFVSKCD